MPVERPITVLVDEVNVGTLWTLGVSPECLALGYRWSRRLVTDVTTLESIAIDWLEGTAKVATRSGAGPEGNRASLHRLCTNGRRNRLLSRLICC